MPNTVLPFVRSHQWQYPQVFVFGSNLAGIHGGGAAKFAAVNCGAVLGIGEGRQGMSYALPTVSLPGVPLTLDEVERAAMRFHLHAWEYPSVCFFVTRVGYGLAGFKDEDIAPMFKGDEVPPNLILPPEWDTL